MPKICRSMLEEDGKPKVGCETNMLGVRVPPDPRKDIVPGPSGTVVPQAGGMSVAHGLAKVAVVSYSEKTQTAGAGRPWKQQARLLDDRTRRICRGRFEWRFALRPDPNDPLIHGFVEPARDEN